MSGAPGEGWHLGLLALPPGACDLLDSWDPYLKLTSQSPPNKWKRRERTLCILYLKVIILII